MGICSSVVEFQINEKLGEDDVAAMFFDLLGLSTQEIQVFYTMFLQLDIDQIGVISISEMYIQYR